MIVVFQKSLRTYDAVRIGSPCCWRTTQKVLQVVSSFFINPMRFSEKTQFCCFFYLQQPELFLFLFATTRTMFLLLLFWLIFWVVVMKLNNIIVIVVVVWQIFQNVNGSHPKNLFNSLFAQCRNICITL